MDCITCRRVAPSLCAYHIMDLSGCDMEGVEPVPEGVFWEYRCPHCGGMVPNTKFCKVCYSYSNPEYLMQWLVDAPRWRCEDCGAPKIIDTTRELNIGPCGRCLRRGFSFVAALTPLTPLTPEQLAHWVKGMKA